MYYLREGNIAEHPYYLECMSVHIYSLEELCYLIEKNIYLIDESWICDALYDWIDTELGLDRMSLELKRIAGKTNNVFSIAAVIFTYSGLYSAEELKHLQMLLQEMNGKSPMERRKMRGDHLLAAGKYRQAIYVYLELLHPDQAKQMTEELQGDILHNQGVAYARMFLFHEAAVCFIESYKLRKNEASKKAYLFAMNYVDADDTVDDSEMDINFTSMRSALEQFTQLSEAKEYQNRRLEVEKAAGTFDWRTKQQALLKKWMDEYQLMIS